MVHTFMTSSLPVCLAVISLTAFNCDVNYFTWKYQTVLHFLCSCSYLFTFLLSSQFYWHIHLKSTGYFLTHHVYMSSSLPYHWQHSLPGSLKLLDISHINRSLHGAPVFTFQSILPSVLSVPYISAYSVRSGWLNNQHYPHWTNWTNSTYAIRIVSCSANDISRFVMQVGIYQ